MVGSGEVKLDKIRQGYRYEIIHPETGRYRFAVPAEGVDDCEMGNCLIVDFWGNVYPSCPLPVPFRIDDLRSPERDPWRVE